MADVVTYPEPAGGWPLRPRSDTVEVFYFDQYGAGATAPEPPPGTVVEHLADGGTVHRTPDDGGRAERLAELHRAGLQVSGLACEDGCCLTVIDPELRPPPHHAFEHELYADTSTLARRAMFDVLDDDSALPFVESLDTVMRVLPSDYADPLYRPL